MLKVEPPEYYPIIDKLFASRLVEALNALGIAVEDITALVVPDGRTLRLGFEIKVSEGESFLPTGTEYVVRGLLDKLADEANSSFGRLYQVDFSVEGLKIEESTGEGWRGKERLVVNGPDELVEKLERLGRGIIITLREWGVEFSTLTINVPLNGPMEIKLALKTMKRLSPPEKESLKESLEQKTLSFSRTILGRGYPVSVRILDPEDRVLARAIKEEKSVEDLVKELVEDEDVRELLSALGKSPPGL